MFSKLTDNKTSQTCIFCTLEMFTLIFTKATECRQICACITILMTVRQWSRIKSLPWVSCNAVEQLYQSLSPLWNGPYSFKTLLCLGTTVSKPAATVSWYEEKNLICHWPTSWVCTNNGIGYDTINFLNLAPIKGLIFLYVNLISVWSALDSRFFYTNRRFIWLFWQLMSKDVFIL